MADIISTLVHLSLQSDMTSSLNTIFYKPVSFILPDIFPGPLYGQKPWLDAEHNAVRADNVLMPALGGEHHHHQGDNGAAVVFVINDGVLLLRTTLGGKSLMGMFSRYMFIGYGG